VTLRETVSSHSTRDREGVDRVHLVPGRRQRLHPQVAVAFDADHDLPWLFGVGGYQFVQFTDAGRRPVSPSGPRRDGLRPVVSDEDHRSPLSVLFFWVNPVRAQWHPATT